MFIAGMSFRIPPTSKYAQMAAVGRATGVWDRREHTFYFQMPPKVTWSFQVYLDITNLTLIHSNVQVAMLTGEIMIMTMRVTDFNLKESLGVPLEYGPLAISRYGTWMSETEVTMIKFFSWYTSYLFKMTKVRTAFNACGYLTFCDETLVSLGHRISTINNYASVHDLPNENPSADSFSNLGKKGNVSPRPSRDTVDSAEDSDDEITEQNAYASNAQNVSNTNNNSPPSESETAAKSTQNLTPVIEYEDISDQIELTNQNIQGIVSLIFERGEINGETWREVLQILNPTVVLDDVNKEKWERSFWTKISGSTLPIQGMVPLYDVMEVLKIEIEIYLMKWL